MKANRESLERVGKLEASAERGKKKIKTLQSKNRHLMQELLRERRISNQLIDEAMRDARVLTSQALSMMNAADKKAKDAESKIMAAKDKAAQRVRKER